MGYEIRHGNKLYYYTKKKVRGRVVSHYHGPAGSPIVEMLAHFASESRENQQVARQLLRQQRQEQQTLDQELDKQWTLLSLCQSIELLLSGCHTYKGQWRRIRKL